MCRFAVQQFRSSRSTRFCAEGWQRGLRKPAADQSSLLSAEPHLLGSARWLQHGSAPPEGHRSPSSPATGPGGPLPGSALPLAPRIPRHQAEGEDPAVANPSRLTSDVQQGQGLEGPVGTGRVHHHHPAAGPVTCQHRGCAGGRQPAAYGEKPASILGRFYYFFFNL